MVFASSKLGQIEQVSVGFLISHLYRPFLIAYLSINQHFTLIQAFRAELYLGFEEIVVAVNNIMMGLCFDWPTIAIVRNNGGSQQLVRTILTHRYT